MKTKLITGAIVLLLLASMPGMAFKAMPVQASDGTVTDAYVSDMGDLWWSGPTEEDIDGSGYIVPRDGAAWSPAVLCWEPDSWDTMLNPPSLQAKLFEAPSADWIWKTYQVTDNESYTGDIVFFKKRVHIPVNAVNIEASLFIITADNAYYFYVNDPSWSGFPHGIANFAGGYNPANFYYVSDGVNNRGGGADSVLYETPGNLYPLDVAIPTDITYWSSIEEHYIPTLLHPGENWLQIVAINEHAEPTGPEHNPAGLIYKLTVSYDLFEIDIKPGSYPSSINLNKQGLVPVAVLTRGDFDATTLDPSTVLFAGASPVRWSQEDVDNDGDLDLVFHFETSELNLNNDSTEATLTGTTYDGQTVTGTDAVNIVSKDKAPKVKKVK